MDDRTIKPHKVGRLTTGPHTGITHFHATIANNEYWWRIIHNVWRNLLVKLLDKDVRDRVCHCGNAISYCGERSEPRPASINRSLTRGQCTKRKSLPLGAGEAPRARAEACALMFFFEVSIEEKRRVFGYLRERYAPPASSIRHWVQSQYAATRRTRTSPPTTTHQGSRSPLHASTWQRNCSPQTIPIEMLTVIPQNGIQPLVWIGNVNPVQWNAPIVIRRYCAARDLMIQLSTQSPFTSLASSMACCLAAI